MKETAPSAVSMMSPETPPKLQLRPQEPDLRTVNKPGVGYIDAVETPGPWKQHNGTEVKNSSSGLKMDGTQPLQRLSGRKFDLEFSRSSAKKNLYEEGYFDGPQFLVTKQSTGRRHPVITREMQELSRRSRQFSESKRRLAV